VFPGSDVAGKRELNTELRCSESTPYTALSLETKASATCSLKELFWSDDLRYGFPYALTTTFQSTLRIPVAALNITTEGLAFVQIKLCLYVLKGN